MRIYLYVCRPLNGNHKITILCDLCGSAVINVFNFNKKFLNIHWRICKKLRGWIWDCGFIEKEEAIT